MKNKRVAIFKIILADTAAFAVIFIAAYFILSASGLMFRQWIYFVSAALILIGAVAGIIQLLLKIKKKILRIILIVVFVVCLLLSTPLFLLVTAFAYHPEHIVEKGEKKYLAYVSAFIQTEVYYFEYKNFIVAGNKILIKEDYGKGGFDPIDNKYGYTYNVESVTYYDE